MNIKKIIPQKIKNLYHFGQAILANFVYSGSVRKIHPVKSAKSLPDGRQGSPASQEFNGVKIIGVTGTNGKTTTVWMIGKILEEAGFKVALNSTINFQIGGKKWVNQTKFTTLSSFAVQKFIREAVEEKCDYLVLETSSHSLDQFRVWGVPYEVAVVTNVTREHLDYHQTMEKYRQAKSKLFKNLKSNFQFSIFNFQSISNNKILEKNKKISIVNLDMDDPEYFLVFAADEKYGYTTKNKNVNLKMQNDKEKLKIIKAENIKFGINYSNYQLQTIPPSRDPAKAVANYKLNLPGKFNIENALAATCVGLSQGIDPEIIRKALEKIEGIPGRMEYVPNSKNLNIIIDYAVTPDSLKKLYQLIKEINTENKKIIAVLGACGERDRGKRPLMGEIVAQYADRVIITNEDPYGEDPQRIINEIFAGVVKHKKEGINFWRILDRREAIKKALTLAQTGDFVIVTGKGAEETMAVGKERITWKEKAVIQEELNKI